MVNRSTPAQNKFKSFWRALPLLLVLVVALAAPFSAAAQDYYFSVPRAWVDVYWETDGSMTVEYEVVFQNGVGAHPIDVVDLGLPNRNYSAGAISASLNGQPASFIDRQSPYIDAGPAIWFSNPIPGGASGTFRARVVGIREVLYTDNQDSDYASALFMPNYFGSEFTYGTTDLTVTFHLPHGVTPDEPRWHTAGHPGFPDEPLTGRDSQGRITYTWRNTSASPSREYVFGASFPAHYVPAGAILEPSIWQRLGLDPEVVIPFLLCLCFAIFIIVIIWASFAAERKRRMQYLPPKIAIEGHGIKRGLTAPEAAVLLEQPMDKILGMILFSTIKKGVAEVVKQTPLELKIAEPPYPLELRDYEQQFIGAFREGNTTKRRKELQDMMVRLVKGVGNKMRGFSKRETTDFYRKIAEDAWTQVEAAGTPKVQSKLYEENLEWTMMDKNYERRTRDTFGGGTVHAPMWWGRYDPTYRSAGAGSGRAPSAPTRSTGGGVSLPTLPGGNFAASVVQGAQNMAGGVIGNLSSFTGGVTKVTNPPPPPSRTSSGGGGFSGGGSSCACACAGCACACAGGGR
ncbi:MAG: hypothetical protein KIS85_05720 [Anaerolineales bacterium]|nr:hypothetical protein [Anaerolineales bacterium]